MDALNRNANREDLKLHGDSVIGLDAYSRDNQFIGRVTGFVPAVREGEEGMEQVHTDPVGPHGEFLGPRHIVIDGTGTIVQSTMIVTADALQVDLRGRRATVPLTIAEIEAMPHHDPNLPVELR